jgi:integrase
MARPARGRVEPEKLTDGTFAFRLRFRAYGKRENLTLHERRDCDCGCMGGWTERTAQLELNNVLARVQAGVWERPKPKPVIEKTFTEMPLFDEYASYWLKSKLKGLIGKKPITKGTHDGYLSMLRRHLLPFFGRYRLDEIDDALCAEFRKYKIKEAHELKEALDAGADVRDERNRKLDPLGPASIQGLISLLGEICQEAFEDKWMPANPARGKRLKLHVPKPKRTFLEMDELAVIEDAAAEQDPNLERFALAAQAAPAGSTAGAVALRLSEGKRQKLIASELGLCPGTIHFHVRNLGAVRVGVYVGRKALVCTLGRSGVRNSELSGIQIGHLRVHDLQNARLDIPDSKTETGIRIVEISPYLAEVLTEHIDRLRKAGFDTGPTAPLFPNERGKRMSRKRVGTIVHEAAVLATERMRERGLPPLAHITPHSLRRTYITIALLANNYDIKWVMDQVGHADSKMTMDVYNQLQQRAKREHGTSFDRLIRDARVALYGDDTPAEPGVWAGDRAGKPKTTPNRPSPRRPERGQKLRISRKKAGRRSRCSKSGEQRFQSYALPTELSRRDPPILARRRTVTLGSRSGRAGRRALVARAARPAPGIDFAGAIQLLSDSGSARSPSRWSLINSWSRSATSSSVRQVFSPLFKICSTALTRLSTVCLTTPSADAAEDALHPAFRYARSVSRATTPPSRCCASGDR